MKKYDGLVKILRAIQLFRTRNPNTPCTLWMTMLENGRIGSVKLSVWIMYSDSCKKYRGRSALKPKRELSDNIENFVVVPADKDINSFTFVCKNTSFDWYISKIGINDTSCNSKWISTSLSKKRPLLTTGGFCLRWLAVRDSYVLILMVKMRGYALKWTYRILKTPSNIQNWLTFILKTTQLVLLLVDQSFLNCIHHLSN